LEDRLLAVVCASHDGRPEHVAAVREILAGAGLSESELDNTPALPLEGEAMRAIVRAGGGPASITQNCSGKHAGMLATAVRNGWPTQGYRDPEHPVQRLILDDLRTHAGAVTAIGVDGCGAPVFGMPLAAMATVFARLARPDALGDLAPNIARATDAMRANPYLVAGRKREDTAIMEAAPNVVVKTGAEALLCAADLERGIGVAVKVADGADRAAPPSLLRTLRLLDVVSDAQIEALGRFARPWVTGGGERVGELEADIRLSTR